MMFIMKFMKMRKKKAEEDRNLAISSYLEAKRIKELYMIQNP